MADEPKAINLTAREKLRFATWLKETAAADRALAETWQSNNVPAAVIAERQRMIVAAEIVADRLLKLRADEEARLAARKTRRRKIEAAVQPAKFNGGGDVGGFGWLHALRAQGQGSGAPMADVNATGGRPVVGDDDL